MVSCFIRFCRIITPPPPYHQPTLADHPPPSKIRDVHMNVLNHRPCDRLPCRPFISPLSRPFALAPRAPGSPWREHTSLPFDDRVPDPPSCRPRILPHLIRSNLPRQRFDLRRPTTTATTLQPPPSPYHHRHQPTITAITLLPPLSPYNHRRHLLLFPPCWTTTHPIVPDPATCTALYRHSVQSVLFETSQC
jgi:hypothetical protein